MALDVLDSIFDFMKPKDVDCKLPSTQSTFVHYSDASIVENLITPGIDGPWIAGGACLAWYQHHPCDSDIDVYFRNEKQYVDCIAQFKSNAEMCNVAIESRYATDNAVTFKIFANGESANIQFICKDWYESAQAVIDSFDITVCQIAWDGTNIYWGKHFVEDVKNKTLRFAKISPASHKRLVKYICYGYEPHEGCIESLIQHADIDWETKGSDHYA